MTATSHPATTKPKRLLRCIVSSDKMTKSRVGKAVRLVKHPLVGKYIKRTTKVMFHDEHNESKLGDEVLIYATRPRSAHKNFCLYSIVRPTAKTTSATTT